MTMYEMAAVRGKYLTFVDALKEARQHYENGEPLRVQFSPGNSKMGVIPSVSLLPLVTCPGRCWQYCGLKCYAAKIAKLRPNVRRAYAKNSLYAAVDISGYFREITAFCKGQRFFRWHVSGDIPAGETGFEYFRRMVQVAIDCPQCQFLVFTKNYGPVNLFIAENGKSAIPENLKIIFSCWGDMVVENYFLLPESQVIFNDKQPDDNWKICGGNCYECACRGVGCWELKERETIAFYEH